MLAGANQSNRFDEVDVNPHVLAEVTTEDGDDLLQRGVGEARALDDVELDRTELLLHDLELFQDMAVILEQMSEESAGQKTAVGADDDRLHAALDLADQRQPAPARTGRSGSRGEIAERVAD